MKNRARRGLTMIEAVMTASLTVVVLLGSVSTFLFGTSTWLKGQARIDAQSASQLAVRQVSEELRQAMSITVDGNGQGLTYTLPAKDTFGKYIIPLVSDGIAHRIELNGSTLRISRPDATWKRITYNVSTTDPNTGLAYKVFTPNAGAVTRMVTIEVVTTRSLYRSETVTSRSRETVVARNVPVIVG